MFNDAENERIETDTEKPGKNLRTLEASYVLAREEERKHIAREVHDELGQVLAVLRMNVSLLRIQFGRGNPQLMEKAQGITELTDQAIQGMRNVVLNLRPPALDNGIVSAIGSLCARFARHTAIPCTLEADTEDLDEIRSLAIFRIVQESLANTARHAEAGSVKISLARQGNSVLLEVHDNGRGFDPQAKPNNRSLGLAGMRERAVAVGGDFSIASAQGQGTTISVCIPIAPDLAIS